jgi:hypothetical protein
MKIMVKNVIVSWIFNLVALHGWSIQASMLFLLAWPEFITISVSITAAT